MAELKQWYGVFVTDLNEHKTTPDGTGAVRLEQTYLFGLYRTKERAQDASYRAASQYSNHLWSPKIQIKEVEIED